MHRQPRVRPVMAAISAAITLVGLCAAASPATAAPRSAPRPSSVSCQLGNGVKHVISLVFDNVHFFRDNPNVPSDLEQMPHLLNFLEVQRHGAVQHAHAADRAHRRRQPDHLHRPVRRPARPAGEQLLQDLQPGRHAPTRRARSRTGPTRSTTPRQRPTAGHDTTPDDGLLADRAGQRPSTGRQTPAPWVPFTRAGCTVGDFSTANMVLENTRLDLPHGLRCRLTRGGAVQRRLRSVQGRRDRRLRRRRPCTARRALRSAPTRRASSTARPQPVADRRRRHGCRPSRAATPATRRCSAHATSPRSSAQGTPITHPQRLPGHRRERVT